MSTENEALIQRFMEADRKLREAEEARPAFKAPTVKPVGKMTTEEAKAESKRLAAENPALVRQRAKTTAKRQHAQTTAERNAASVRAFALAAEAEAAYDDAEAWTTDEETYEETNPRFEDAIAAMLDIGEPATAAMQRLIESGGIDIESIETVAEMVMQRNALRDQAELIEEGNAFIQSSVEVGKKLEARVKELVDLNPQFNPAAHLAEAERLRAQLPHIGGPDRVAIQKLIEDSMLAAEAARNAQADAVGRFVKAAESMPAGAFTDYDVGETALIGSFQVTDALIEAEKTADTQTRSLRARADAEGIGVDSRDASGRLVLMPVAGGDALYVSDDAAGALLAQGSHRLIRDDVPIEMPDLEAAFYPQPTAEEIANDWAASINEADAKADDDALQAQIDWANRAPSTEGQAAAAEAAEAADKASRLAQANQLLP